MTWQLNKPNIPDCLKLEHLTFYIETLSYNVSTICKSIKTKIQNIVW